MDKIKNKKRQLAARTPLIRRVGLAFLSVFVLSACDSSLPPLFGGEPKRPVMVTQEEMKKGSSPPVEEPAVEQNKKQVATPPPVDQYMVSRTNKNLFGKSIRSDNERLNRLERAVQDLRNDFDTVQPSIRRLMAIESDIQELIGELRTLSEQPKPVARAPAPLVQKAKPAVRKPKPATQTSKSKPAQKIKPKPASYQNKSAPPVKGGKANIFDVRSGEHPGKTRLVLDINTKTSYNVDIDNNENIMVVDLPNTTWTAATSKSFPKSSVISSYNIEKSEAGSLMVIQLKKNAKLSYDKALPSNNGTGQRIVLDVSPQ